MSYYLSPIGVDSQYTDASGVPLTGGLLWWYMSGSTNLATTYTTSGGTVDNTNPIVLNSLGQSTNEIWFLGGQSYKAVLETPPPFGFTHGTVLATWDNITGINDTGSSPTNWIAGGVPTFISATQFSVTGDQTLTFVVNRRVWAIDNGVNLYGTISVSTFNGTITTVTVAWDSGSLDASLTNIYYANTPTGTVPLPSNLLHPYVNGGWRDIIRSGWKPWNHNQVWGGPWNCRPDSQWGDCSTGFVMGTTRASIADSAAHTYRSQGFMSGQTTTLAAVWVNVSKTGNPTNSLVCRILPDDGTGTKPTGNTPITNGTATSHAGISVPLGASWVRFVFPTPPAITANTVYHIVLSSSGAFSGTNYWGWGNYTVDCPYPYGNLSTGDGTPAWTANSPAICCMFLVEPVEAGYFLRAGGVFSEAYLSCSEGSPLMQSRAVCSKLSDWFDRREFTYWIAGSSFAVSKPICDLIWGIDHNRVLLSSTAGGLAQIDLYTDQDATKAGTHITLAASAGVLTSGNHVIGVHVRAFGDGSDRIDLYVDGTMYSSTGLTFTFSTLFGSKGTAWLGGALAQPTWTQKLPMTALPSASSWTFAGTATEANVYSIQSVDGVSKLIQNGNAFASTDTAYYSRSTLALNNTTGWGLQRKLKITGGPASIQGTAAFISIEDGTKILNANTNSWWVEVFDGAAWLISRPQYSTDPYIVGDSEFLSTGKGSDFATFLNGAILFDASGRMITGSATNRIRWGDLDAGAAVNLEVQYDSFAYTNAGSLFPTFTSGSISEFAFWSGNQTGVFGSLYNGGSFVAVKTLAGSAVARISPLPKTSISPTNSNAFTAPTEGSLADSKIFYIGDKIQIQFLARIDPAGAGNAACRIYTDGSYFSNGDGLVSYASSVSTTLSALHVNANQPYGVHGTIADIIPATANLTVTYYILTAAADG